MKKFENILIVSDIDETFLGTGSVIVERNVEALKYFLSEGGKFTFATGRVHGSLLSTIPIAREIVSAPAIVSNGVYLYDFATDTPFNCKTMDEALTRQVAECIYDFNDDFIIRFSTPRETFFCRVTPEQLNGVEKPNLGCKVLSRDEWDFKDCCKITVRGNCKDIDALRSLLEEKFDGVFQMIKSADDVLDVLNIGCSKGASIADLRKYYRERGIEVKVYTCGDYENDILMHKAADVSVCPSNAIDAVKEVVDMILCHCSEGLIADLISKIDL